MQKVEFWVYQFFSGYIECFGDEFLVKGEVVENKVDIKGGCEGVFDFCQFFCVKFMVCQSGWVDCWCIVEGFVIDCIGNDFFDFRGFIVQFCQCVWYRVVDDFEIVVVCEFFEFYQCEVRFDVGGVIIYYQIDGVGWCDYGNLCVVVVVFFVQCQCFVLVVYCQLIQCVIRDICQIQCYWFYFQCFIIVGCVIGCIVVVVYDVQYVVCVFCVVREWFKFFCYFS